MATEPVTMNWRDYVGRFSVDFEVANYEDVVQAKKGFLPPEHVRRNRITGIVDTRATRLVLPESVVSALGLPEAGQITVRFADGRREPKAIVGAVQLEIQGRSSVFTAVVEPGRTDALIGAIVLEEARPRTRLQRAGSVTARPARPVCRDRVSRGEIGVASFFPAEPGIDHEVEGSCTFWPDLESLRPDLESLQFFRGRFGGRTSVPGNADRGFHRLLKYLMFA